MDAECLWLLLPAALTFGGLECWNEVRFGAVVCSTGQQGKGNENARRALWTVWGGGLLFLLVQLGVFHQTHYRAFLCPGLLMLALGGYFLCKVLSGRVVKLGAGGFLDSEGTVLPWKGIRAYEWQGKEGGELILYLQGSAAWVVTEGEDLRRRSTVRFSVPLFHKATVERYLTNHVPKKE